MAINIEDTLWMRQMRVQEAQQQRLAAMQQIAQTSEKVGAIQQEAVQQEAEVAPQQGAIAAAQGRAAPSYTNPRLQRLSQMGAQGYAVQQAAQQRAMMMQDQAKKQAQQWDIQKMSLEWAKRQNMSDADNEARALLEKDRQSAENYRFNQTMQLHRDQLELEKRKLTTAASKEERAAIDQKLKWIQTGATLLGKLPKDQIFGNPIPIQDLPPEVGQFVQMLMQVYGGSADEYLGQMQAVAQGITGAGQENWVMQQPPQTLGMPAPPSMPMAPAVPAAPSLANKKMRDLGLE